MCSNVKLMELSHPSLCVCVVGRGVMVAAVALGLIPSGGQ